MSFLGHFNCLSDRHPAAACSFHGILTTIACVPFAFSGLKKNRPKGKEKNFPNSVNYTVTSLGDFFRQWFFISVISVVFL